jgi:aryl-alcohol dehydrogenase-like predicted oxidoreductase
MNSKLCLGTVQFGKHYGINNTSGQTPKNEVFRILDYAYQNGIEWLDTAEDYGNAQEVLGEYLKLNPGTFKIQSKISDQSKNIRSSINKTLDDLHLDSLDSYLFHSYNKFKSATNSFKSEIASLKESGTCKSVGVSIYENQEGLDKELIQFSDEIQIPFNILDNYHKRETIIKSCKINNIKLQTRSVFLQGILLMKSDKIPDYLESLRKAIISLENISQKFNLSKTQLSLGYSSYFNFSEKTLIGVDSLNQLKQNLMLIQNTSEISEEIINELNRIEIDQSELLNPSKWINK